MQQKHTTFRRGRRGPSPFRHGGRNRSRFAPKRIEISRYINKNVSAKVAVEPYAAVNNFSDFALDSVLNTNITTKGYKSPTHIQDVAIPEVLKGKDVVGIANTGTGKTAAFLIPLIQKVAIKKDEQVLIIVPTRELAVQIQDELRGLSKNMKIFSVCVVGGTPIYRQIKDLKYFNSFVIGTPGRIKDLLERKALNLSKFKTIVLDETDRMLDMGFIKDVRNIMDRMSTDRHTLFFSATLSTEIENLIKTFLKNPIHISVKKQDISKNIFQDIVKVEPGKTKTDTLHALLGGEGFDKVLIFGRTKHGVQKLSDDLARRGHSSVAIHGNKNQSQRFRALNDFKSNKSKILVATDVAARGLDIPNVSHVINFDIPATHEDYVHRIGRTGRAGELGKALTFVE